MEIKHLRAGMRIQIHPGADLWMRGVKYGTITKVGRKFVEVSSNGEVVSDERRHRLAARDVLDVVEVPQEGREICPRL